MERVRVDPQQYNRLWGRYLDRLILYAQSLLGDRSAAEDAVQAVFLRILDSGKLPEEATESSYLFRSVRNEASNELRSRGRARRAFESFFKAATEDPREAAELAEFGRRIQAALQDLPEEEREAVVLKTWGALSFPEAAAVTGVSEKTFEHRYYRGLDALKDKMGVRDEQV
jgi:RNA polymerase sigma-70 factor (ECF subfamily)